MHFHQPHWQIAQALWFSVWTVSSSWSCFGGEKRKLVMQCTYCTILVIFYTRNFTDLFQSPSQWCSQYLSFCFEALNFPHFVKNGMLYLEGLQSMEKRNQGGSWGKTPTRSFWNETESRIKTKEILAKKLVASWFCQQISFRMVLLR